MFMNSLFPTVMPASLPVGEYYELKSEEIENQIPENTPTDGKYCYMLSGRSFSIAMINRTIQHPICHATSSLVC